jgi:hypothetical protein
VAATSSRQCAISSIHDCGRGLADEDRSCPAFTKVGPRRSKAFLTRWAKTDSKSEPGFAIRSNPAPIRTLTAATVSFAMRSKGGLELEEMPDESMFVIHLSLKESELSKNLLAAGPIYGARGDFPLLKGRALGTIGGRWMRI